MISKSDYWHVEKKEGAKDICIVFSAANTQRGSFILRRSLKNSYCHRIFLNCPDNNWYLDGVPGLGINITQTAASIKNLVDNLKEDNSRVICVGTSMGGYGALIVGSLICADYIFATGAELILGLGGSLSKKFIGNRESLINESEIIKKANLK